MFVATQWTCPQCATQDIAGETCPNCGWRNDGATVESVAAPPSPLAESFQATPDKSVFVLRQRNMGFVMGRTQHFDAGFIPRFLIIAPAAVVLIVVVLSYLINEWNISNLLKQSGVVVEATVTDRHTRSGRGVKYYVVYEYTVNNNNYVREASVIGGIYDQFPPGAKINVKYLASDPKLSILADYAEDDVTLASATFWGTLSWIGAFIATVYLTIKSLRDWRLSKNGILSPGQVVMCSGTRGSKGSWYVSLWYAFQTPGGRTIEKVEKEIRNDLRNFPLPEPGTPVAVLYVTDRLFEVM